MRKTLIAGNWKMNGDRALINTISNSLNNAEIHAQVEVLVCPPSVYLSELVDAANGFNVGAQNVHQNQSGAFTGELSAGMLKETGCSYVILGHSERRSMFIESDEVVGSKVKAVVDEGLTAILCVGETLEERESGNLEKVISKQVKEGVSNLTLANYEHLVIAYEPVWAIGTGKTASPEQAQEVHAFIRSLLVEVAGADVASRLVILYGGSMNANNAETLLAQVDIDGGLIGGASLKPDEFLTICRIASDLKL